MTRLERFLVRALLCCYPSSLKTDWHEDFENEFESCVRRESERLGRAGVAYAWLRLLTDALTSGLGMRFDEYRAGLARRRRDRAGKETRMRSLWQDLGYAGRLTRRSPIFSVVVVLTIALAIGATTAVFSVLNAALIKPLPYTDPDRLVLVYEGMSKGPNHIGFSVPDYLALEPRASMFSSLALFRNREYELSDVDPPERLMAVRASPALFSTLGVTPAMGTLFSREDDEARRAVVLISHRLWKRKFAGDPAIVGRVVRLDRFPYTIVGVMPEGFTFPNRGPHLNGTPADLFLPIMINPRERQAFGSNYNGGVIARLAAGTTAGQADTAVRGIVHTNAIEIYPAAWRGLADNITASVVPLRDEIVDRSKLALFVVFAAVGLVLLIACGDIASLILTRALSRHHELATRVALGAGRGRIIRQLFIESSVLAFAGGALGVLLGGAMMNALVKVAPSSLPRIDEIGLDWRVLLFSTSVAFMTAVICGLIPAVALSRRNGSRTLIKNARSSTPGARHRRLVSALIAAQVAVAFVLLIGGGLLVRSFTHLMSVDPGFRADHALTVQTRLPANGYPAANNVRGFYTQALDRLQNVPGVTAAGGSSQLPLNVEERRVFTIDNEPAAGRDLPHSVANEWILGRHFEALGIPLKKGRVFQPQDAAGSESVAVINETMARMFFGSAEAIDARVAWGNAADHAPWMRIVGIVGDMKQGPLGTDVVPEIYTPWLQAPDSMVADNVVGFFRSLRFVIRSEPDPITILPAVRDQFKAIDPALPLTNVQTLEDVVRSSTSTERFNTMLVGLFGVLALLLAAIGIGGALATSVTRRTREFGVRLALGARPESLVRMVMREAIALAALGLAIGVPTAWLLSRIMSSLLFDVSPRDPVTFVAVIGVIGGVAIVASLTPAWRASRVEPIVALRVD